MPIPIVAAAGILAKAVPWLARKIKGDKAGRAAEKAVGVAMEFTGLSDPVEAAGAIANDPKQLMEFRARLLDHTEELEALANEDRASARQMHMATGDRMPAVLAVLMVVATVALAAAWIWVPLPDGAIEAVVYAQGQFHARLGSIYDFYFGSSAGSKIKDGMLAHAKAAG